MTDYKDETVQKMMRWILEDRNLCRHYKIKYADPDYDKLQTTVELLYNDGKRGKGDLYQSLAMKEARKKESG